MYTCGPTVYGPGHLGHARSYIAFDLLKRVFLYNGYQVKHVLNITDIHDDMIKTANKENISIQELAEKYIPMFKKDLADLNVIPADKYPRVTDHVPGIIEMVKTLVDKGFAYVQDDGSVYFDVEKFDQYGKLSGIKLEEAKTGTRIETDKYDKENAADFALWKGYQPDEPFWESPWGKGRPGWHIECSVMANEYLGKTIDIHAGAMDLKFPHHENEIAQSEAASGQKFVNYWIHAGLLEVENQKMSKSLGNFLEIHQIVDRGYQPLALRYLFLMTHYRSRLNFTWESLDSAQKGLDKLRNRVNQLTGKPNMDSQLAEGYQRQFKELINDNLAVPQALALVWEVIGSDLEDWEKKGLIGDFDQVLGLDLIREGKEINIPAEVMELVRQREAVREKGNWNEADELRQKIEDKGYQVIDGQSGYQIKPLDESRGE
jgi:cysteinyl-tRNA synthetase